MKDKYFDRHGNQLLCPKCNAPLVWDILTGHTHDDDVCMGRQLQQAKAEIKKLRTSLQEWKEAWFELRDIIGRLWWNHPALSDENTLRYYQNNLKVLKEKDQSK